MCYRTAAAAADTAAAVLAAIAVALLPTQCDAWAHYMASMMCARPLAEGEMLMGYPAKSADGPDDIAIKARRPT